MQTRLLMSAIALLAVAQLAAAQATEAPQAPISTQPNTTPVTPKTAADPNPTTNDVAPPFDEAAPADSTQPPAASPRDVTNPTANQTTADDAADRFPDTDSQRDARTFRQGADAEARTQFDPGFEVSALDGEVLSIGGVSSGGLAAQAGLQANDRIVSIDGRTFTTVQEFRQFAPRLAGRRVPIVIERGGQQQTLSIDYPAIVASGNTGARGWLGVYLSPDFNGSGARISRVVAGSPAMQAGLRPGDIVTGLDGQDVWGWREFVGSVSGLDPDSQVQLNVLRDGRQLPITATVATIQRAAYRGDIPGYRRDSGYYGEPPAAPQYSDYSRAGGDRLERLEQMVFELQREVRELRAELSPGR